MDDSYFALNTVHNGYELEKVFGIRPHMLSECYTKEDWDSIMIFREISIIMAIGFINNGFGTIGMSFWRYFVAGVPGNWHLFVFSDDIPWCKEHAEEMEFGRFRDVTYVEGNVHGENYRAMQLMSMCEAMIISNSAFCYLAALLNTRMSCYLNCSVREFS